ncbi:hypothetical protein TJA_13360 [Thermus sp. LT1-2-5]|uniref:DUF58 domain-containing protein n=1 Tax=Thermus sp. LT1-2-5 TaxID=3026935 RepID=UPI0030EAAD5B
MSLLGLLALGLLSLLYWAPHLARVRVHAHGFPPGFPGQRGEGRVAVALFSPLPLLFRLEALPSAPLGLAPRALSGVAWGRLRLVLPLGYAYRRRGLHPLRLSLGLQSPLGFGKRVLVLEAGHVLVYPSLRALPPYRPAPSFYAEGLPATFGLPDPLEAKGLRPFTPGDTPRLLARKASARLGYPVVREVEKTLLGSLFLHIDTQSLHPSYLDHATSLAAWLLLQAEARGERFGLSAGEVLPLGRGRAHLERALSLLARLAPTPGPALPPPAPWGSTYLSLPKERKRPF